MFAHALKTLCVADLCGPLPSFPITNSLGRRFKKLNKRFLGRLVYFASQLVVGKKYLLFSGFERQVYSITEFGS